MRFAGMVMIETVEEEICACKHCKYGAIVRIDATFYLFVFGPFEPNTGGPDRKLMTTVFEFD